MEGGGKVCRCNYLTAGITEIFHHIAQFPNIAPPLVRQKHLLQFRRKCEFHSAFLAEMLNEQKQVAFPLTQRRNKGRQRVQPVIQIPAKTALLHTLFQIFVGGSNDAHIHPDDLISAHRHDLMLL